MTLIVVAGPDEVPDWLQYTEIDVANVLAATTKLRPAQVAAMAAMANQELGSGTLLQQVWLWRS